MKRIRLPLLIALLLLSGCSTIKDWMGSVNGPQPTPLVGFGAAASFTERWHSDFGEMGVNPLRAALTRDAVYGASGKGLLTRLDRSSGKQVWRVDSNVNVTAGVGAGDGLVVIGSDKGEVLAFDEAGKQRWSSKVSSEVLGVPQVADGVVVVRSGDGHIAGLNAADGKRVWVFDRSMPALVVRSYASVTIQRGLVFAGFAGGKLIALKLADGSELWENNVSQPRGITELERISDITSNPVVNDTQVCAIAFQGNLACFDAVQGSPLWSREISSDKGLFIEGKSLYATDARGAVIALEKDSGSTIWKNEQLLLRNTSASFAQDGFVVVGDFEGYLHALSRDDGRFVARIKLSGSAITMAPVQMDDGLLVQTQSGDVYSLSIH